MSAFYDKNGCFYISIDNEHDGTNIMKLGSVEHKNHITKEAVRSGEPAPDKKSIAAGIDELRTEAIVNEVQREVFVRVAPCDNGVVLDLAGQKGRAVLITPGGATICKPPVDFIRPNGVEGLPEPDFDGSLDRLAEFLPGLTDDQWKILIVWILASMMPNGPFPILLFTGAKGTAKSTTTKILRQLIDPSTVPLQSMPRNERDLMITAKNSRVLAFDNLRQLRPGVSDCMCRLSTGGGFKTRKLFANDEEAIFNACRPIILNGINGIVGETDLLDRTLFIELATIMDGNRRTEEEILSSLTKAAPAIFGGMCQTLSKVLQKLPLVKNQNLPRMADFARIGIAVEMTLGWEPGSFLRTYEANRDLASTAVADNDPLAHAVSKLVQRTRKWQGTASALLDALAPHRGRGVVDWPLTPRSLSVRLRSLAGGLQGAGTTIEFDVNVGSQKRLIRIGCDDSVQEPLSAPLSSSPALVAHEAEKQPEHARSASMSLDSTGCRKDEVDFRSLIVQAPASLLVE